MHRTCAFVLITAGLAVAPPAAAAEVVVFGDDWLVNGAGPLQASLTAAGVPVSIDDAAAVGASTATAASTPDALADRVALNTDARWVVLSLGHNDFLRDYRTRTVTDIRSANATHLRALLTPLFRRFPDVRVVLFGTDWSNFTRTSTCQAQASALFGATTAIRQINADHRSAVGGAYRDVADAYRNVDYVDLFGTLQTAGGVAGAPDPGQPSPASLMFDCRYPTTAGFRALMDRLVAGYFGAAPPRAAPIITPAPTCVGQTTMFTSQSTAATDNEWRIDGVLTSTRSLFATSFTTVGPRAVSLWTANGAYTASTTVSLSVLPCTPVDAGTSDAGPHDAAAFDAAALDAGAVRDADAPNDAGAVLDAGPPVDVGVILDVGVTVDAGVTMDATVVADAGSAPPDTGVDPPDTGVGPPDTGIGPPDTGRADATAAPRTYEEVGILGSGCNAGPHPSRGAGRPLSGLVALVAALAARRRRPSLRP